MKVLLAIFEIQDYGGIVGHTEDLANGLIENGHDVDFVLLRNSMVEHSVRKADAPKNSNPSVLANGVNNLSGWYGCHVIGYASSHGVRAWKSLAAKYDLVIYEVPVPKQDCPHWKDLFDIKTSQISVIHDAHYQTMYPHLKEVSHLLSGVAAVHPAAYYNMTDVSCRVELIGNPIRFADWATLPYWNDRRKRIVCAHVWKRWKNMHIVVQAAPYIKDAELVMGGDGIEGRYMRSVEKCKPQYEGLWAAFKASGHEYRGLIPHEDLMSLYQDSRVMVDMSYSKKFVRYGSHFNRSVMEALNHGCVPICTRENMDESKSEIKFFKENEHYLAVPAKVTPETLAEVLTAATEMSESDATKIIEAGRELLMKHFDRRVVADKFLSMKG